MKRTYVDVVGESLPSSLHAFDLGLSAELAFGTNFKRNSSDLTGENTQLGHHVVDGGLEVEHLALDVDLDLLGEIASSDGGGDIRDRPHLVGDIERHFLQRDP
jgi:hypothetical protein